MKLRSLAIALFALGLAACGNKEAAAPSAPAGTAAAPAAAAALGMA